jgi:hypothetical protein
MRYIKLVLAFIATAALCTIALAQLLSLSLNDTILAREMQPSYVIAAPSPGNMYRFTNGKFQRSPLCSFNGFDHTVAVPDEATFVNVAGQIFPPVTNFLADIARVKSGSDSDLSVFERNFYQVEWKFDELSIPEDSKPKISPNCAKAVARALTAGDKVCIVDTVLTRRDPQAHANPDGSISRGSSFAFNFKPTCIQSACKPGEACEAQLAPTVVEKNWTTQLKIFLGLISTS